jgi:nucleoid DNA-binding protein
MNKAELIGRVADRMKLTKKETQQLYDALVQEMTESLSKGSTIAFPGFGIFSVTKVQKRKGFNPLMEKWMMLPPKMKLRFKVSATLKKRINP